MAGESDVAVAQVVHEEEDEVGFVEGLRRLRVLALA